MLAVGFASGQFTGSKSSRFIEVVVRITGGTSSNPITVTVTPTEQSPVSAMGELTYNYVCSIIMLFNTGSGVDFNSNPFNITINAGATEGRGNVPVVLDNVVEASETFDMTLMLVTSSTQVTLSRSTSVGQIIDSTGKWMILLLCGIIHQRQC